MVETNRPRGFDYLEELVAAGVEVSFLTESLDDYADIQGFERHKLAARVIEVRELRSREDISPLLRGRLGPRPLDGVLCFRDEFLVAAACLARDLGLPHEPVSTVRMLRDKAAVRERLTAAGVGTLRWRCAATPEGALAAAAEIGYPVVVKPVAGHGSIGVSVLWTERQAETVLAGFGARAGAYGTGPLLVEEYRAGLDVAAELLVQNGRPILYGFGERLPAGPNNTVELGGHFPARFEQRGAARRFVTDVVRALGIRNSALHIELLITPTGPELVEVNGRMAGYVIPRQIGVALRRSIPLDLLALCTSTPVEPVAEPVSYVALRNLCSEAAGEVRAVDGPSGLPAEVIDHWITVRPGDRVVPTTRNAERFGYVLAAGFSAEAANRAAEDAFHRIRAGLRVAGEQDAAAPGAGEEPECGPHVVLLLDAKEGGARPERVLDALGAVTGRVTVFWCGPDAPAPALRERWSARFVGAWYDTPGARAADVALADVHARHPVAAVVTFEADLRSWRDRLAGAVRGDAGASAEPAPREEVTPLPVGGHTVLSVVHDGAVRHLDVVEDLGTGPDGHRTLSSPPALPEGALDALRRAADRAVTGSGISSGVVRTHFPAGAADGPAPPVPDAVVPGLDEATHAVHDAGHARDVVTTAVSAALGRRTGPAARVGAAVFRSLAAPAGALRVVAATPAADLFDHPEVRHVRAELTEGQVRTEPGPGGRLHYAVAGATLAECRAVVARVESGLVFRHAPLDRTHVVVIDRVGAATWTRDDGTPLLPPARFRVSVLSGSPSVKERGAALDVALHTDVFDHAATAETVAALHRVHPVQRIAAASERLLAPAAALRERLGLPGDTPEAVRGLIDKAEMKRLAARGGIAHAEGHVLYEPGDAHELIDRYGAVVVKPRDLSGSQGVAVCDERADLERWLRERFVPGRYLVERKVSGPMGHLDALVHEGIVAWDVSLYRRDTLAYTRGQPLSSRTVDDPALRRRAGGLLERIVDTWGIRSGVLHAEFFVEGDRLVFCEVAGRPGGAGVIPAFRATRGFDLRHAKILLDAGEDPRSLRRDPVAAHAGWVCHYCSGGVLAVYDDSTVAPHAYAHVLRGAVGAAVAADSFSGTSLSTHVFANDSSAEIDRLVTAAERDVRIVTTPTGTPPTADPKGSHR